MDLNDISGQIVDVAYKLHVALGSLLLEHVYESSGGDQITPGTLGGL